MPLGASWTTASARVTLYVPQTSGRQGRRRQSPETAVPAGRNFVAGCRWFFARRAPVFWAWRAPLTKMTSSVAMGEAGVVAEIVIGGERDSMESSS